MVNRNRNIVYKDKVNIWNKLFRCLKVNRYVLVKKRSDNFNIVKRCNNYNQIDDSDNNK